MQIQDIEVSIADAILSHRLAPGQHLNEAQLAKAFGVSRSVMRLALIALEGDGLVRIEQNRGAFVAKPTLEDAVHLFQALAALEKAAVDIMLSAPNKVSSSGLGALEAIYRLQMNSQKSGALVDSVKLALEFHTHMVSLTGNRFILEMHRKLLLQYRLVTAVFRISWDYCALEDHHISMVDLLREGSSSKLKRLIDLHWKHLILGDATAPSADLLKALKG